MISNAETWNRTNSVKVGACNFTFEDDSKRFYTMSLSYSEDLLLTPNQVEASALYQVIRQAIIEGQPEAELLKLESDSRSHGAGFTYLRPIYKDNKLWCIWMSIGALSLFAKPERLTQLYNDMCEAVRLAGCSPSDYLDYSKSAPAQSSSSLSLP